MLTYRFTSLLCLKEIVAGCVSIAIGKYKR